MYNNISIQTTLLVDILWIACVRGLSAVRAGTRGSARQSSGVCERELPVCAVLREVSGPWTLVHLAAAKRGMAAAADGPTTMMANLLLLSIILLLASNPGAECALVNRHCHKTWDKGGPVTHQMW